MSALVQRFEPYKGIKILSFTDMGRGSKFLQGFKTVTAALLFFMRVHISGNWKI